MTVVVILVVVFAAAWELTGGFAPNTSNKKLVLASADTYYTIPVGQFNGITFLVNTTSVINGTISNSFGIVLYQMNNSQFFSYVKTLKISGYEWTSGVLPNGTAYGLDLTVPPGAWVLVFVNPALYVATAVGFITDLTLAPA